jgi:hypothetical protein
MGSRLDSSAAIPEAGNSLSIRANHFTPSKNILLTVTTTFRAKRSGGVNNVGVMGGRTLLPLDMRYVTEKKDHPARPGGGTGVIG